MYLAGAREEGKDVCVFPPSHSCGKIFKPRMEVRGNRGTPVLGMFFLIQWNFEGLIIY